MKPTVILMICLLVPSTSFAATRNERNDLPGKGVNEVNVAADMEVEKLATAWIEAFREAHPDARVNLISPEKATGADIRIITAGASEPGNDPGLWKIVVGRDVIVPVMNQADPYFTMISGRGISPAEFKEILSSDGSYTWDKLLGTENNTPVSVMIPDDRIALASLTDFAAMDPVPVTASRISKGSVADALTGARSGVIVFCRLADITGQTGQNFTGSTGIIPVDINGNGKSDYFEQFYDSFDSFNRGVYIGKYPRALCNSIYAVSDEIPAAGTPSDLIGFILADGQRFVAASGFTALARGEGMIKSEMLASDRELLTATSEMSPVAVGWLWVLAVVAAVSLLAYAVYSFTRARNIEPATEDYMPSGSFSARSLVTPAGIMYDRSHAWTFMEKNGTVNVGIDDFLQHMTGVITRIRMKATGDRVRKGDHVVSIIQNGKKLDIPSPVSGTIVARNERLMTSTGIMNSSPYDEGWIYTVEPDNWEKESHFLISAGRYTEFLKEELSRIKDFFAAMPGVIGPGLPQVVLQDGGEFREGLLEGYGPEIWEEFQVRFLDQRHGRF